MRPKVIQQLKFIRKREIDMNNFFKKTSLKHHWSGLCLGVVMLLMSTSASAALSTNFPLSDFFCKIAAAVQSKWAPGIILIILIAEGILYLVSKKGVMQNMMIVVIAATLIFSAAKFLNLISPGASCGTIVGSVEMARQYQV